MGRTIQVYLREREQPTIHGHNCADANTNTNGNNNNEQD